MKRLALNKRQTLGHLLLTLALLASVDFLHARGGVAGAFLRLGIGARAKAMGNAYTAIASGVEASYYNPAGLPFLEFKEVVASYRALSLDRQYTFIGFAAPVRPKSQSGQKTLDGGIALSWIRAGVGDIDGRDTDGRDIGSFSNSENAFVLSFALSPTKRLAFGLSVKVLWNRFPDIGIDGQTISASGVGFDLGVLATPRDWITVGLTVRDINSKYTWSTTDLFGEDGSEVINRFPKIVRTGVAVRPPQVKGLTLAFEFEDSKELDSRIHLGAEGTYKENFLIRGGLDDGSITLGGGYSFELFGKMSQVNYAFATPGSRPEEEHVFTWVFRF